ncbi:hypothetical protein ACFLZW_04720 [Chloroflexota bacterium]
MKIELKIPTRTANLICLALLGMILAAGLAWGIRSTSAAPDEPEVGASGLRKYYLSVILNDGFAPYLTCADGYHMASLWEILDTSNFEYDTSLGILPGDGGAGPNSNYTGWVRTGYSGDAGTVPGEANCNGWATIGASDYGTLARLDHPWAPSIDQWKFYLGNCNAEFPVWCVED